MVRVARARGLDGVCLTEHDALWPLEDVRRLSDELEFTVLRGMEVTTEVGHVLVYGLASYHPSMAQISELRGIVESEGAVMYLAHPSRRYGTLLPHDLARLFESVESLNASEGALQNETAAQLAERLRLPGIGGSDAHSAREAGRCATRFGVLIVDEASLVAALRAGTYEAVQAPREL